MSHKINQNMLFWKDVEAELRCTPMIFRGTLLCEEDSVLWARVLTLLGMQLQDILSDSRSPSKHHLVCKKYVCTLADLDAYDVSATFKWLSNFIRRYYNMDVDSIKTFHDFKHHGEVADYLIECCTFPVKREIEVLLASYDTEAFRKLAQLFAFTSHVTFSSVVFEEIVDDFAAIDAELAITTDAITLQSMNSIMREWFAGFRVSDENFFPHHGPGGIAETGRASLYEKYRLLSADSLIVECFRWHNISLEKYFLVSGSFDRTSRLVAVPKSTLTSRTICMEPATLQFLQQGVLGAVADWIENHYWLSKHIKLRDQSLNRMAARSGSIFGELATIDLSAASDCVSWELTRALFAGTDYLQWCLTTRSSSVRLPDDSVIRLNKFAPMGSALCFPTECLVFACACEQVRRQHRVPSVYRVYGDDLVIEQDLVEDLIQLLTSLGFKVNMTKSFTDQSMTNFRESCGGEYACGVDVTPYRVSRWLTGIIPSMSTLLSYPQALPRYIAMCNEMYEKGLITCRNYLVRELCGMPSKYLPVFGDGWDGTILSPYPDNYRHCRRFNSSLWRQEIRTWKLVGVIDPRDEPLLSADDYESLRLHHWFVCKQGHHIDSTHQECFEFDPLSVIPVKQLIPEHTLCRSITKLRSGYVPV